MYPAVLAWKHLALAAPHAVLCQPRTYNLLGDEEYWCLTRVKPVLGSRLSDGRDVSLKELCALDDIQHYG